MHKIITRSNHLHKSLLTYDLLYWFPYNSNHSSSSLLLWFSHSVVSNSLWHHGQQHRRPPCPSSSPGICSDSCPLSQWCHPTISSLLPPSPHALNLSQYQGLFQWVSSHIRWPKYWSFSISFPMNIQGWFPLGLTGLTSLQSKGLSGVFSTLLLQLLHDLFSVIVFVLFRTTKTSVLICC